MPYNHQQVNLYIIYQKCVEYMHADKWIDLLKLTEVVCYDPNNIDRSNRGIWFHRAIALVNIGQNTKGILTYKLLMQKFPLEPFYHKMLIDALGRFETKITERYFMFDVDDSFEVCLNFLNTHYYVPWSVRKIHFRFLLQRNRYSEISNLSNLYLDLNPYDYDYLSEFFRLSQLIPDNKLLKRIISICDAIPQTHIDKIKIEKMLFEFFESTQGDRLC